MLHLDHCLLLAVNACLSSFKIFSFQLNFLKRRITLPLDKTTLCTQNLMFYTLYININRSNKTWKIKNNDAIAEVARTPQLRNTEIIIISLVVSRRDLWWFTWEYNASIFYFTGRSEISKHITLNTSNLKMSWRQMQVCLEKLWEILDRFIEKNLHKMDPWNLHYP